MTATTFREYDKIDTLFERGEDFIVDPTRIKRPVLATISQWEVTEKIDGTNIRIHLGLDGEVTFGGRTDNAQLPADLLTALFKMFPADKLKNVFWKVTEADVVAPCEVILYGEGYGVGIQKGSPYRADKSFILFDVLVDGKFWLNRVNQEDVAGRLGIEVVPYLGLMGLGEIVELVKQPFSSKIGTAMAEGVVGRPVETLFDQQGRRIMLKLKTKDFVKGRR